jgi:excisionase family DNA binding protein
MNPSNKARELTQLKPTTRQVKGGATTDGTVISLKTESIDPDDPISLNDVPVAQVYTVRQVAKLLDMNLGLTYELVRKGEIPAKRLGRRWVIPRQVFHAWLNTITPVESRWVHNEHSSYAGRQLPGEMA